MKKGRMTTPALTIHPLPVMTEGHWNFSDNMPSWRHHRHGSVAKFDPFPAYAHKLNDVQASANHVQNCLPPLWPVDLYVADREEIGRSNGFSNIHEGGEYINGEWVRTPPTGLIVLSGKRVPPHPSVTDYLVAHEYGHNAEWMISHLRGATSVHSDDLIIEYAKVRGLPDTVHHGSGGRWHNSAHEIFACDFRILICLVEVHYWPHPGVPHPSDAPELPAITKWWGDVLAAWPPRPTTQEPTP